MKNLLYTLLLFNSLAFSQSSGITYQAVIYNPAGEELPGVDNPYAPLINQNVCLQFGVVDAAGNVEYQEQVQVTTDAFGMVNLLIGTNTQTGGYASDFSNVQWSADAKFLKVDLDIKGTCSDFEELSNQPFTYVPFAYYSPASDVPGPQGPQGPQGVAGTNGVDGNGIASTVDNGDGTFTFTYDDSTTFTTSNLTGSSAYEVWLAAGNTGSEADYLASLVGADGQGGVTTVGGGLELTGTGTVADPYMISLPTGGTEGQVLQIINGVPSWVDLTDSDNDGIWDTQEGYDSTNPSASTDSDSDGVPDYLESSTTDTDSDGVNDQADSNNTSGTNDTDGDGVTNAQESADGTDPTDALDFVQSGTTMNDQDGTSLTIETYCTKVWTSAPAENVTYRDGTPIPQVSEERFWEITAQNDLRTGAWCYFNNDPTKRKLYNWYAIKGIHDEASLTDPSLRKEFAPAGWHVPTAAEWTELENCLIAGGYNYDGTTSGNKIAKSMSGTTGWNSSNVAGSPGNDQGSNNSSGFNAIPTGFRMTDGGFANGGDVIGWWIGDSDGGCRYIGIGSPELLFHNFQPTDGFAVRFIKD